MKDNSKSIAVSVTKTKVTEVFCCEAVKALRTKAQTFTDVWVWWWWTHRSQPFPLCRLKKPGMQALQSRSATLGRHSH